MLLCPGLLSSGAVMNYDELTQADREELFDHLDLVRESGEINIFDAPAYLREQFDLSRKCTAQIFAEWMENFSE